MLATSTPPARPAPASAFTFTCAACETVRIRPDTELPDGWTVEQAAALAFCYCADCSIDVPEAAR